MQGGSKLVVYQCVIPLELLYAYCHFTVTAVQIDVGIKHLL